MVLLPQIVRAALELHDGNLRRLAMANYRRHDLTACQCRLTDLDIGPFSDQQHLAEFDGSAGLCVELFDAQHPVLRHPILLAASGDDRVHSDLTENGPGLKGRAFYWRTLPRSNGSFLNIGRDLAQKFTASR